MTSISRSWSYAWRVRWSAILCLLSACQGPEETAVSPAVPSEEQILAPLKVGSAVRQIRLAFRPTEVAPDLFEGGDRTYRAQVASGRLSMRVVRPSVRDRVGSPGIGAPFELETVSIERGGSSLLGRSNLVPEQDGALLIRRGEVAERLQNTEQGVEQSWTFPAHPAGAGDLVVRVRANGLPYTGVTHGGLHFADATTGWGLRYGAATWIDAAGQRDPVALSYDGAEIVLRVPSDLVERSAYPAVLDPVVGPEFDTDRPVSTGAPLELQINAAVGSTGSAYLVVWSDQCAEGPCLMGTRVSAAGRVLDRLGMKIVPTESSVESSALSWNGSEYLLTYALSGQGYYLRLDPNGRPLDAAPTLMNPPNSFVSSPHVASDGSGFLVVWENFDFSASAQNIHAARVNAAGDLLDPSGFVLSPSPASQATPDIAWNGNVYLVAWTDARSGEDDIFGALVRPDGTVVNPAGITIDGAPGPQRLPAVAQRHGSFLVVYTEQACASG